LQNTDYAKLFVEHCNILAKVPNDNFGFWISFF